MIRINKAAALALALATATPAFAVSSFVGNTLRFDSAAGVDAVECLNVGCRLSLGSLSRYWTDDGAYFTVNTGINISGNVLINVFGSGESGFQNVRTGTVGTVNNPTYVFGRIVASGINVPEFRLMYSDDTHTERSIFEIEGNTGTFAGIRAGTQGSFFEGYATNSVVFPSYRLSNSTGSMALETGPGGSTVAIAAATCAANVVTFQTTQNIGFEVGGSMTVNSAAAGDDTAMPAASTYTIATVIDAQHFTATASACTNGTTSHLRYVSADTDAIVKRNTQNGGLTFVSGMLDGASSGTVGLYTFKPTNNVTDTDLLIDVQNSAGAHELTLTEAGALTVTGAAALNAGLTMPFTDDSANTGNRTVNKATGINTIAAAGGAATITSSFMTANSVVLITPQNNDAACVTYAVTKNATTFTVTCAAGPTANYKFMWAIINGN